MGTEDTSLSNKWLVWIILAAVALRVGASIWMGDQLLGAQQNRAMDQLSYDALAKSILKGHGYAFESPWYPFREPAYTPTAHWSFLYPAFISGIYIVFGPHPIAVRFIQAIIIGILNTWLVYRLGRRLFGEKAGLLAAGLNAIYPYFIYYDATLMTEPFFIAGVLASLEMGLNLAGFSPPSGNGFMKKLGMIQQDVSPGNERSIWRWIELGVVLGATALLRQTILLWIPFFFGWIFFTKLRKSGFRTLLPIAASIGIILVFILPWTVRNYTIYHAFLPLNSNAGYALYSANHPHHGTQFDQDFAAPLPPELVGKGLSEVQWNTELTRRGLQFIIDDPGRYLKLSLNRVSIFYNFWFSSESSLSSNLLRVFSFGMYLPFFLLGLVLSWHRRKRCSLIYLFVAIFSLIHILTWASIRYRLPIDSTLMPFAAIALLWLYQVVKEKKNLLKITSPWV
jgi:4-amino-4-deoxy-L-arabinose transferase-like glycosyltransferase